MLYQVLVRANAQTAWDTYGNSVEDPFAAMRLIQLAGRMHAEVTIVQAADAFALGTLLQRVRLGQTLDVDASPVPTLTATPKVHVQEHPFEGRRWEIEEGPGGDHDAPYAFTLPIEMEVQRKWLGLMARYWREAEATVRVR